MKDMSLSKACTKKKKATKMQLHSHKMEQSHFHNDQLSQQMQINMYAFIISSVFAFNH